MSNGTYLGRTAILGIRPVIEKVDDIPGWNGYIYIRELTPYDVDTIVALRGKTETLRLSGHYMVHSICDEDGKLLFKPGDIDRLLKNLGYNAVNLVVSRILKLSDLGADEEEGESDKGNAPN